MSYIVLASVLISTVLFIASFWLNSWKLKTGKKNLLNVIRILLALIIISLVLISFALNISHKIKGNQLFDWNYTSIPKITYNELEAIPWMIGSWSKIWYIDKSWNGDFRFKNNNSEYISLRNANKIKEILDKNNVESIYIDTANEQYSFHIQNTWLVFVLKPHWNIKQIDWQNLGSKKYNRIINENWAMYEQCTRSTCPEIDK